MPREKEIVYNCSRQKWLATRYTSTLPAWRTWIITGKASRTSRLGFWPGKVNTYFDPYVAGVWNIFHAARLLLISLIIKVSAVLGDTGDSLWYIHKSHSIAQDIASSIPYHLTDDLYAFLNEFGTSTEIRVPEKVLGGLLLIHPLYVASYTPILSEEMREYMHRCLEWIGSNMGLGQAALLAKVNLLTLHRNMLHLNHISADQIYRLQV